MSSTRTIRPYLLLVGVTVGLVVLLAGVGTACYLVGLRGYGPLVLAFAPLAVGLAIWATARRRWSAWGFRRPRSSRHTGAPLAVSLLIPLLVPLAIAVQLRQATTGRPTAWVGFVGLALLVGFVEESIFRGALLRLLLPHGRFVAVAATSLAFALAHSAAAISPDQNAAASVRQVVFALMFGVLAAVLTLAVRSVVPAIGLHALVDGLGFLGTAAHPGTADLITIGAALVAGLAMVVLIRTGSARQPLGRSALTV